MIDGLRVKASTYDQKISGKCLILKFYLKNNLLSAGYFYLVNNAQKLSFYDACGEIKSHHGYSQRWQTT